MTQWVPRTDGKDVWAVDPRSGTTRKYMRPNNQPVVGVSGMGDSVTITTKDGRVRVWNPNTDHVETFL